jgi:hypothetical protein
VAVGSDILLIFDLRTVRLLRKFNIILNIAFLAKNIVFLLNFFDFRKVELDEILGLIFLERFLVIGRELKKRFFFFF